MKDLECKLIQSGRLVDSKESYYPDAFNTNDAFDTDGEPISPLSSTTIASDGSSEVQWYQGIPSLEGAAVTTHLIQDEFPVPSVTII